MKIDLSQFRQIFLQESAEHVATMESGLLALRSAPDDVDTLNAIFRSAHSIKGGAGSFGLDNLVRFTHGLESLLDRLRAGEIAVTDEVIAMLLESVDVLRLLLEPETVEMPAAAPDLIRRFDAHTAVQSGTQITVDIKADAHDELVSTDGMEHRELSLYRVEFRPDRELFSSGTNPILLLRDLATLGQVSASEMHADELPKLSDLDPAQCYLAWTIELTTLRTEAELREVFEFVEHLAEISIQRLDVTDKDKQETELRGPDRSSVATTSASTLNAETAAAKQREEMRTTRVAPTSPQSRGPSRSGTKATTAGESSSIRVATDKVDRLIDLVGELVIAHVMTAQMVERFTPDCLSKLRESVAAMERNTRELHERVMSIRMLPVGTLFHRYTRTVYDIAQSTCKQIRLITSGEETEIDKSMLELLGDPMTHLIRNAADHGVELPEVRVAAGKPAEGTIRLSAFHRAGRVVIEISDDGGGMDLERIRAKAIERGLITPNAQLSDEQLRMLIFEPGFSTCDEVSDLSGRGVGMDVVRQNVQRLNGTVTVASQTGTGSTVSIELPLTLAILEGLLIGVAGRTLVLPLLSVVETVSPRLGQIERVGEQGEVIVIRNQSIPLLRLRRFVGLKPGGRPDNLAGSEEDAPRPLVVVVETGRKKIGLVVDELLGQQQVVVKSLEKHLRRVEGLMGATILGDGCVAPIVDIASLANMNLFSGQADTQPRSAELHDTHTTNQISPTREERGESAHAMV